MRWTDWLLIVSGAAGVILILLTVLSFVLALGRWIDLRGRRRVPNPALVGAWDYVERSEAFLMTRSPWTRWRFLWRVFRWYDVWKCSSCGNRYYLHDSRRPPKPYDQWRPACGTCNTLTPCLPTNNFVDLLLEEEPFAR